MSRDVLVLGAGLAGLAAARDLAAAGADVARARGPRAARRARRAGRARRRARACSSAARSSARSTPPTSAWPRSWGWRPSRSYVAEPGEMSWDLAEGAGPGRVAAVLHARRRARRGADRGGAASRSPRPSTRTIRGAIPTPPRSTRSRSPAGCARRARGRPSAGCTSWARWRWPAARPSGSSLLGQLRMISAAGAEEIYGYERWEGLRLTAGSAALPLRMAEELGDRLRLGARVIAIDVAPRRPARDARGRGGAARRGDRLRAAGRAAARRRDQRRLGRAAARACTASARRARRRSSPPTRADLARGRRERAERRRGARQLDLAAGRRRALDARRARAARALPRRAAATPAAPRSSPAWPASTASGRARPTRCSSAPGAPTRSRRATSRSGHRATSWPSVRSTARTSRRSTSAAPTTGWRATWRVPSGRAAPPRPLRCSSERPSGMDARQLRFERGRGGGRSTPGACDSRGPDRR